ncbi:MAG: type I 3-dehydroquinate dehydratase [Erysipelotrichaceae bacterium]|nr:type I 3-dehydroquinate dehydratase [Erysipelotrichaceae bacterium]
MKTVMTRHGAVQTGSVKVCVPLCESNIEQLSNACAQLPRDVDVVEWRMDYMQARKQEDWLDGLTVVRNGCADRILLATWRSQREGGVQEQSLADYVGLYEQVITSGWADLIDVELFTKEECVVHLVEFAHRHGVKVILSNHDWQATPTNEAMMIRLQAMQRMGADLVKLAVMPHDVQDVYRLLQVSSEYSADPNACPLISMAMGEMGFLSRLCGEMSGSIMTFATFTQASAPGQLEWRKMKHLLELFHEGYRGEAL